MVVDPVQPVTEEEEPRRPLLPDFAAKVAEWFPELGGRSIAVSEIEITRENMPTLPLAITALVRTSPEGNWNYRAINATQELYDEFVVEFWLQPVKVERSNGGTTPFWAFYDYELFRNRLLTKTRRYRGPSKQRLEFRTMTTESTEFAVMLSFGFRAHFEWCPDEEDDNCDGQPITKNTISQNMCIPASPVCDPCFDEQEECNPCPSE